MRKTLTILSLIIAITLTSCQSNSITNQSAPSQNPPQVTRVLPPMHLSPEVPAPEILPTTIEDPLLLEGWARLYNQTKPCDLWDGSTITGQELAQYVIDHAIVIVWNTEELWPDSWVDRGNTGNIYLSPSLKEKTALQMDYLMSEMAHEIFHATTPFGQNADTLYEEYWAFYVGACAAGLSTVTIKLYDPLSPDDLSQYFIIARRANYLDKYALYPAYVIQKDQ